MSINLDTIHNIAQQASKRRLQAKQKGKRASKHQMRKERRERTVQQMTSTEMRKDFPCLLKKCSPDVICFLYQVAQTYVDERQKQETEQEKTCERKKV